MTERGNNLQGKGRGGSNCMIRRSQGHVLPIGPRGGMGVEIGITAASLSDAGTGWPDVSIL